VFRAAELCHRQGNHSHVTVISVISRFVNELFSSRWLSVDRSLSEITLQANEVQSDVLVQLSEVCCVQHHEYLSLFWIVSRIGQSVVVRYGANYYRDF
jgi:hypothetical protein